jgi:hypothetical protein
MNFLTKSSLALAVLAGASLSVGAQAQNLSVSEVTTGNYLYTYNITPTFDTTLLTFSFLDHNIGSVSASGPLTVIQPTSAGNFVNYSFSGATLLGGSTETVEFNSSDGPGSFVNIASDGVGGTGGFKAIGPAAVPEASTTISFGLLLMLGLGGLVFAARKKSAQSAA